MKTGKPPGKPGQLQGDFTAPVGQKPDSNLAAAARARAAEVSRDAKKAAAVEGWKKAYPSAKG